MHLLATTFDISRSMYEMFIGSNSASNDSILYDYSPTPLPSLKSTRLLHIHCPLPLYPNPILLSSSLSSFSFPFTFSFPLTTTFPQTAQSGLAQISIPAVIRISGVKGKGEGKDLSGVTKGGGVSQK